MSHQDRYARGVRLNSADLFKSLQWLTRGTDWSAIRMRREATWTPQWLAWMAILWAWSNESTLRERFDCAQRLIQHFQSDAAKASTSYQAFYQSLDSLDRTAGAGIASDVAQAHGSTLC